VETAIVFGIVEGAIRLSVRSTDSRVALGIFADENLCDWTAP
jgi:hypothetical protein